MRVLLSVCLMIYIIVSIIIVVILSFSSLRYMGYHGSFIFKLWTFYQFGNVAILYNFIWHTVFIQDLNDFKPAHILL